MIVQDVVAAIVAGDRTGAGAVDVVCVREIAERDLSKNSTMALVSINALYRLSVSSLNEFSYGTTRTGTVAGQDEA